MPETPNDPFTELESGAAHLHEIYTAYVSVGFSEDQAMILVTCILNTGLTETYRGGG